MYGLPRWLNGKESACNAGDTGLIPGSETSSGEGNRLPTPVFFPGESHGQRSLAGYSPGGCKGSDVTKVTEHTGNAQKVSGCVAGHSLVGSQMRLVGLWTVGRNRGGATPPVTMAAFSSMFAQG